MKDDKVVQLREERLRARLAEDLGSQAEAGDLLPAILRLRQWHTAGASEAQHQEMLARLHAAVVRSQRPSRLEIWLEWRPLLLLRAQIPVVQREIWTASAFLMALGAVLSLLTTHLNGGSLTFVLMAPVIAATGIALLYNDETEQVLELERAMPDPVGAILLARLSLVFGFDVLLGIAASLPIAALNPALQLGPFILSWLAPMALLSSLAFLISVTCRDSVSGILASLSIWCAYHIWQIASAGLLAAGQHLLEAAPYLMGAAMLLAGLALWRVEHSEGQLRISRHVD